MKRGAPSKFRDVYCDEVINHMAEGASLTSFAAEIGVCRDTISEWCNVHPEFSASVKKAKAKCAAWWEKVNRSNAVSNGGNATACIFGLKNMAPDDWRDKSEQDINLKSDIAEVLAARRAHVRDQLDGE